MGLKVMAVDPSLTSTGWAVFELESGRAVSAGVIRTVPAKKTERLTTAQDMARRGVHIRRTLSYVIGSFSPALVVIEGNAGSKSAKAAAGLARAQQATVDACDVTVGGLPEIVTPQSVKSAACGSISASKEDMKRAALRWCPSLAEVVEKSGQPKGKHEHMYDCGCIMLSVWRGPTLTAYRAAIAQDRDAGRLDAGVFE